MNSTPVSVGTTATVISNRHGSPGNPHALTIKVPSDGQTVFIGGSGVTGDEDGFALEAGETLSLDMVGDSLYGIVASGTQAIQVLQRT